MTFLKNTLLCIFFLYAMYWGGIGTQSNTTFSQGMGFFSVILACSALYVLFKLLPRALSYSKLSLIIACVIYSAYCLGFFNNTTIKQFLTGKTEQKISSVPVAADEKNSAAIALAEEMFGDDSIIANEKDNAADMANNVPDGIKTLSPQVKNNLSSEKQVSYQAGVVDKLKEFLYGKETTVPLSGHQTSPFDYPSVRGYPRVILGSLLQVNGLYIKLFGIAAPELDQTCADKYGRGYYCGREAVTWLQDWLNNREVVCYVMGNNGTNRTTGVCFVDNNKYDVAAVVTNAGWAVAYTVNTQMYVPYEQQAIKNKRGLWQGSFYKPWDWVKMKNRNVEIVVNTPKPKSSSSGWGFDFKSIKGLF